MQNEGKITWKIKRRGVCPASEFNLAIALFESRRRMLSSFYPAVGQGLFEDAASSVLKRNVAA